MVAAHNQEQMRAVKQRQQQQRQQLIRLQLGAGPQHSMPGWLNVDGSRPEENQKPADGTQLYISFSGSKVSIPLPSASCEFVYASHVLEHLSMEPPTLDALLIELRRLLVPGGVVRLVVPDAAVWLSEYVAGLDTAVPPNDEHYGRVRPAFRGPLWQQVHKNPAYWPHWDFTPEGFQTRNRGEIHWTMGYLGAGGAAKSMSMGHQLGLDFEFLKNTLAAHGFNKVRRCSFGGSAHAALHKMDSVGAPAHMHFVDSFGVNRSTSLFIEATG